MTLKLIACDMDGTFLDEAGQFDQVRFRRVLDGLKRDGIRFVVASGRPYLALKRLFADFEDDVIFVAENGALVIEGDVIHYEALMSADTYLAIAAQLDKTPFGGQPGHYLLSGRQNGYVLAKADESYIQRITHFYDQVYRVETFDEVTDDIFKVTADLSEEQVMAGSAWLTEHLPGVKAMTTGFRSIDLISDHVDKRTGLEGLCQHLRISPDEVMVFGDNLNDYGMMTFAGTAIAPENAREEIKAIADQIIGPHTEGSVLTYLEELINGY